MSAMPLFKRVVAVVPVLLAQAARLPPAVTGIDFIRKQACLNSGRVWLFAVPLRLPVQGSPALANPFSGAIPLLRHHPGSLMQYAGWLARGNDQQLRAGGRPESAADRPRLLH